ncbi:SCO0607 family lipoprotein [Streptomyces sp. NPDC058001]|uniref:SCO0607 family lipoprotein n=1 Tax=Streptomyces sp. NPDC058001 TaxID=3346300 RepID=UPI0036E4F283
MNVTTRLRLRSTGNGARRIRRPAVGLALASATVAILATGCSMQDAKCGGGEYPIMTIGGTGSACASNGEDPPKGFVRYPEGKEPKHVDDKWDKYWRTHTVDKSGEIIKVSDDSQ